jgi:hypothetical protein
MELIAYNTQWPDHLSVVNPNFGKMEKAELSFI